LLLIEEPCIGQKNEKPFTNSYLSIHLPSSIPHSAFDMSPEFSLPLFTFPKEWTIEETIKGHGSVSLAFLLRR